MKPDGKNGAFRRIIIHPDHRMMILGDFFAKIQTEAGTFCRPRLLTADAIKFLKDISLFLRRNSESFIGNFERDEVILFRKRAGDG